MSVLPVGLASSSGVDVGDIQYSLRFRSGASAYLSRTFGTPTNQNAWAFSCWLKLSDAAAVYRTILGRNSTDLSYSIGPTHVMWCFQNGEAGQSTSALFRDYIGFVHLCIRCVSSNSTEIYINNTLIKTITSTNKFNVSGALYYIGGSSTAGEYFGGYMSRICFVDGTALTPSSFGRFNTEINEWVSKSFSEVKAVVDAGGTNSFMLDFKTSTLGADSSSKGNTWTANNFSTTAGTTCDWPMLDVPGNSFATLNPLASANNGTIYEANLHYYYASTSNSGAVPTIPCPDNAKTYVEIYIGTMARAQIGITSYPTLSPSLMASGTVVSNDSTLIYYSLNGVCSTGATNRFTGGTYTSGQVLGMAIDTTTSPATVQYYIDGAAQGTPVSALTTTGPVFVYMNTWLGTDYVFMGGQAPLHASATYDSASGGYFRYTPPSGYKALCQRNMPDPAILNPEKHFDVDTYTGTGAALNRTGFQLQPDFVWIKGRASTYTHALFDSIRGITKILNTNTTDAEATESAGAGLTAFNADGYSLGTNAADASTNVNTQTFAAWLWKMGGAGVTNTSGSITSTVSANVEAGQSIVTYTGTGANATVGHGLGKAPGLVIVKNRDFATGNWAVYHNSLTSAQYVIYIDGTGAQSSNSLAWNSTAPTSTVFSLGSSANVNGNAQKCLAYCFAEIPGYSKIGSYTGNGSADGPFVYCGFKPKYALIKRTDVGGDDWVILDTVRGTYNVVVTTLSANASSSENSTNCDVDFDAFGFKIRHAPVNYLSHNTNGGTYIFYAVADVAAKYSLGR